MCFYKLRGISSHGDTEAGHDRSGDSLSGDAAVFIKRSCCCLSAPCLQNQVSREQILSVVSVLWCCMERSRPCSSSLKLWWLKGNHPSSKRKPRFSPQTGQNRNIHLYEQDEPAFLG